MNNNNFDQPPKKLTQMEINKIIDDYRNAEDQLRRFKYRWKNMNPRPDWYDEGLKLLEEEFAKAKTIFDSLPPKNPA